MRVLQTLFLLVNACILLCINMCMSNRTAFFGFNMLFLLFLLLFIWLNSIFVVFFPFAPVYRHNFPTFIRFDYNSPNHNIRTLSFDGRWYMSVVYTANIRARDNKNKHSLIKKAHSSNEINRHTEKNGNSSNIPWHSIFVEWMISWLM